MTADVLFKKDGSIVTYESEYEIKRKYAQQEHQIEEKRPRVRPRKRPRPENEQVVKQPRGRPRKYQQGSQQGSQSLQPPSSKNIRIGSNRYGLDELPALDMDPDALPNIDFGDNPSDFDSDLEPPEELDYDKQFPNH